MVRVVLEADPSSLIQRDVTESTPLQLFLRSRNLTGAEQQGNNNNNNNNNSMPLFGDLLEQGSKGEDLDILLVLDIN